jgi:hypothetical protein
MDKFIEEKRKLFRTLDPHIIEEDGELLFYNPQSEVRYDNEIPLAFRHVWGDKITLTKNGDLVAEIFNGKYGYYNEPINLNPYNVTLSKANSTTVMKILLLGTTAEWIVHYPELWTSQQAYHFNSFKEYKAFLGVQHLDMETIELIKNNNNLYPILLKYEDQQVFTNLIDKLTTSMKADLSTLEDYYELCEKTKTTFEQPKGINKLIELHDTLTNIENEKKYKDVPGDVVAKIITNTPTTKPGLFNFNTTPTEKTFIEIWKDRGLKVKHLNSIKLMIQQGAKQKHCLGSNYTTLNNMTYASFFTFTFEGKEYDLQLKTNGTIGQFKGYRNCTPPKELRDLIEKDINLKHSIEIIDVEIFNEWSRKQDKFDSRLSMWGNVNLPMTSGMIAMDSAGGPYITTNDGTQSKITL